MVYIARILAFPRPDFNIQQGDQPILGRTAPRSLLRAWMGRCRLVGPVSLLRLLGYSPNHESGELCWGEKQMTHGISVISPSFAIVESID